MDPVLVNKLTDIFGPVGMVLAIILWLLFRTEKRNDDLRKELHDTAESTRAMVANTFATLDKLCDDVAAHDRRTEMLQNGMGVLLDRIGKKP